MKCRSAALAAKFEVEQSTVEGESLLDITDFQRDVVETNGARFFASAMAILLVDEKRRGPDQGAVIDLPDEEVRDVSAADCAEPPVVWRGQDAVVASCGAVLSAGLAARWSSRAQRT